MSLHDMGEGWFEWGMAWQDITGFGGYSTVSLSRFWIELNGIEWDGGPGRGWVKCKGLP